MAWIFFLTAVCASGQAVPGFEVTSVKASPPWQPGLGGGVTLDGAIFRASRIPIRNLIYSAYGVPAWTVTGGPDWLDSEAYDIVATIPRNTPNAQVSGMLQTLLADRFRLALHREMRDASIYALVNPAGPQKLKTAEDGKFSMKRGTGHLELRHTTLSVLATYLSAGPAGRPVVNTTGLTGYFDIVLDWTPDESQPDASLAGPSIFTAIREQLGLKLEPRKLPTEFLVIDHAERPTEN